MRLKRVWMLAILLAATVALLFDRGRHGVALALLDRSELLATKGGRPITNPPICYTGSFYSCSGCGGPFNCSADNGGECYDEAGYVSCTITSGSKPFVYNYYQTAAAGLDSLSTPYKNPQPCAIYMTCGCTPDPNNPTGPQLCTLAGVQNACGTVSNNTLKVPSGNICP